MDGAQGYKHKRKKYTQGNTQYSNNAINIH